MDAAGVLAVVALAIIVAPTIAGWLRLPGIIGLVLAGALVGPFVLGLAPAGALDGLGAIGLLYLMFQAGLEIDLATFAKHRRSAVVFGLLTFLFPLIIGTAEGLWLGLAPAAAVLIGSIWASHTLVTLPEVRDVGLGASKVTTTVAGATVLTDTLALLVLAVVASLAEGGDLRVVGAELAAGLVVLPAWTLWALPKLGDRFFVHSGRERELRFAWLLFALGSAAIVAEFFGIEGLVGAFLAGLGINRLVPTNGPLMERIEFLGSSLLVPAFLVYVGTRLNPAVALQLPTVTLALLFSAALVVGKALAAVIGGRSLGFKPAEWGLMLGMSLPQAAATLAAALVGERVGLFSEQIVNAVVLVVLLSILAGSLITRFFARRVEQPSASSSALGRLVVVGLTNPYCLERLSRLAGVLARSDDGAVRAVAVALSERDVREAQALAVEAERTVAAVGADAETSVRRSVSLDRALLETVSEERASALLTSWDPLDASWTRLFGSQVDRIGRESMVPVIAAHFVSGEINRVVLGLDSVKGSKASRFDIRLAERVGVAAAKAFSVPIIATVQDAETGESLALGEDGTIVVGGSKPVRSRADLLQDGTLLVVTAELVRRVGNSLRSMSRSYPHVSVIVVGGPHRVRLGAMETGVVRTQLGYRPAARAAADSDVQ